MSKNKIFGFVALILVGLGGLLISQSMQIGKFRFIACDIGQGDGMLLITPNGAEVLVDGGPGSRITDCLSRHMPFWDRTIEMVVLTHPHSEHMEGFLDVFNRYEVKAVMDTVAFNKTQLYQKWIKVIDASGAKIVHPYIGDKVKIGNVDFEVIWPPKDKAEIWKLSPPADLNDTSIVMRVSVTSSCHSEFISESINKWILKQVQDDKGKNCGKAGFCMYLTGDLPKEILGKIVPSKCQVLKVVHHGSRTGTDARVLDAINPQLAIIQAGYKNQYGHPHREVLDVLAAKGVKVLRNDLNGEIEVDSDGKAWSVRSDR
jgi:competence protein ComEC